MTDNASSDSGCEEDAPSSDWAAWMALRPVERAMARRMMAAAEIPIAAQWVDVRTDKASDLVDRLRADGTPATLNSVFLHAVGLAASRHPGVCAQLDYEQWRKRLPTVIRIGAAVASKRGLVVPSLPVSGQSLRQTSQALDDLIRSVRDGATDASLFKPANITVSNIGPLGIHGGFPTPSPGQTAILGVASTRRTPVVEGDSIVIGHLATVTLTIDHRAVDGITAAGFLRMVADLVEEPEKLTHQVPSTSDS